MWQTTRMINSKNVTSNNAKNPAPDSFLIAYGDKCVELKVMKDIISMYRNSFLESEKILEGEKQELEKLNYQVWSLEDLLCEQIWRFSHEHDFSVIFQYHPFVTDCVKRRNNCKDVQSMIGVTLKGFDFFHSHARVKPKVIPLDMERSSELIDLINEIDAIKAEMIDLNRRRNVKREIESTLMKLRKLQLISDDVTELLRLIYPSESSCKFETISVPIYDEAIPNNGNNGNKIKRRKNNPDRAKQMKNDKLDFTPKKLVFTTPKNYPQLSLERSIIFTTNTVIANASKSTSNEKLKNFTFKRRSEISIKFQQCHEHKY